MSFLGNDITGGVRNSESGTWIGCVRGSGAYFEVVVFYMCVCFFPRKYAFLIVENE